MADSLPNDVWLIRPCETYKQEYKDCKCAGPYASKGSNHKYWRSFSDVPWSWGCENGASVARVNIAALLSRLYQYYIDGQRNNCAAWLTDYENCMKFRKTKDLQAAEAILEVERQRRKIRLQNAKANDIWEYRTGPPADWFAPLGSDE